MFSRSCLLVGSVAFQPEEKDDREVAGVAAAELGKGRQERRE